MGLYGQIMSRCYFFHKKMTFTILTVISFRTYSLCPIPTTEKRFILTLNTYSIRVSPILASIRLSFYASYAIICAIPLLNLFTINWWVEQIPLVRPQKSVIQSCSKKISITNTFCSPRERYSTRRYRLRPLSQLALSPILRPWNSFGTPPHHRLCVFSHERVVEELFRTVQIHVLFQ